MSHWNRIYLIAGLTVAAISLLPGPQAQASLCTADCNNFVVTVPEPGTFLLLGSGLVGLVGAARRRARRK